MSRFYRDAEPEAMKHKLEGVTGIDGKDAEPEAMKHKLEGKGGKDPTRCGVGSDEAWTGS